MKRNLGATLALAALLFVTYGCCKECPDCGPGGAASGSGPMPGATPGIPYKTCNSSAQCTPQHYAASMFAGNASFANDGCRGGWCRAVLVGGNQCGVANDEVVCEKSAGVQGKATCSSGQWSACN